MRFKRWLALIISSAMAFILLTGCGGGGGSITSTPLLDLLVNELKQNSSVTVEDNDIKFNAAFSNAVDLGSHDTSDPDTVVDSVLSTLLTSYDIKKVPFSDQIHLLGNVGSKALDVTYVKDANSSSTNSVVREWKDALNQLPSTTGSYVCCVSVIKKGDYYFLAICVTVTASDNPGEPDEDDASFIHIQTAQDLIRIAERVNNGETYLKIKMDNTIDLAGQSFTPIGNSNNPFNGIFDGCGYTIQGLKVNVIGGAIENGGLFGEIDEGGIVENLTVEEPEIKVQASYYPYAGGIVGSNHGGTIRNCKVSGGDIWAEMGSIAYAGGIAGYNGGPFGKDLGDIINCTVSEVEIKGTSDDLGVRAGGITGMNEKNITGCNVVRIGVKAIDEKKASGQLNAGGIAGINADGNIQGCDISTSFITAKTESEGNSSTTESNAGGIVGYNNGAGIITNCNVANTQMTADGIHGSNAGGIVGIISLTGSSITGCTVYQNCYIEAWISMESYAGGIVGYAGTTLGTISENDVSGGTIKAVAAAGGKASAHALIGDHPEFGDGAYGCTVQDNPTIIPPIS